MQDYGDEMGPEDYDEEDRWLDNGHAGAGHDCEICGGPCDASDFADPHGSRVAPTSGTPRQQGHSSTDPLRLELECSLHS